VIFWTEFSCWSKSYSNKATLFLGGSHRYKTSTVIITNWLYVAQYPFHPFYFGGIHDAHLFVFFFILCLVTNVVCVSGLSILDWPISWFSLTFIYPDNAKFISFSHISFFFLWYSFVELFNVWWYSCLRYWQRSKRNIKDR